MNRVKPDNFKFIILDTKGLRQILLRNELIRLINLYGIEVNISLSSEKPMKL